uniref:Ig-like domain-containing protein n=1 Tax=Apteryx owenii TaxID=8824 RepID=A0A8B9PC81_APTOW
RESANRLEFLLLTFKRPQILPPVLEETPESSEEQVVMAGSEVTFACKATGSPMPALSWLKDGEPLAPESNGAGSRLHLEAVGPADSGVYSCLAVNEAGEASKHFRLVVMGTCPPGRWERRLGGGSKARLAHPLVCAAKGNPEPRITWTANGQPVTGAWGAGRNAQQGAYYGGWGAAGDG